ncbi:MAG: DNA-directed RNA polymerase subunit omega [Clostridia bacterium]|nr:DNA-directed RNA polymerase subunit omega [Clostridia bacterium]MEE1024102.1 DNA-directed RNA polymerase subunit omega [Acutalibacteraceae bacterium]
MLNPSIGKLIQAYESRYQLVTDVAHYARHISDKAIEEKRILVEKPVNTALNELADSLDK